MSRHAAIIELEGLGQGIAFEAGDTPTPPPPDDLWPNGYLKRSDRRIDSVIIEGDVENGRIDLRVPVGDFSEEAGADIRVEVGGAPISYRLLRYDGDEKVAYLRARLPLIASTSDTVIAVYTGKVGASGEENAAEVYAGLLLAIDGATGEDLTGQGRDGTPSVDGEASVAALFTKPGSSASAFNRPIGSNATMTAVAAFTSGRGTINNDNRFNVPALLASASDPEVTITHSGAGPGTNLPVTLRMPSTFPGYSSNAGEGTALMQAGSYTIHDIYQLRRGGSASPQNSAYYRFAHDVRGLLHGSALNERVGTTAAGVNALAGIVRAAKWRSTTPGTYHDYAFHIVAPRHAGSPLNHSTPLWINRRVQWPATFTDGNAGTLNSNPPVNEDQTINYATGGSHCPMGSLITFPHGFDYEAWIDGLSSLSANNKIRAKNMARDIFVYGIYIVDGGASPAFRADGPLYDGVTVLFSDWTNFRDNFVQQLWPQLRLVTNNVSGATAARDGSNNLSGNVGSPDAAYTGTLRGPNTAWDAASGVTPGLMGDGRPCGIYNGGAIISAAAAVDWIAGRSALSIVADIEADSAMAGQNAVLWTQSSATNGTTAASDTAKLTRLGSTSGGVPNVWTNTLRTTSGLTAYSLGAADTAKGGPAVVAGIWEQGLAPNLYVDGELQVTSVAVPRTGPIEYLSGGWHIGTGFIGKLAELLVSPTALTPLWLDIDRRSKRAPLTLWGVGAWREVGDPDPVIAMPVRATATAQVATDIDVAGSAIGSGTLIAVGAAGRGTVTIEGGEARYTASGAEAGSDFFEFTLEDGSGNQSTGRCDVAVLPAVDPEPGGPMPTPDRVVNVSTSAQLATAIANLAAGDKIVLADGNTYTLPATITNGGTSAKPVVIASATKLGARINGGCTISGDHIGFWGVEFQGTWIFDGTGNFVLRCRGVLGGGTDWIVARAAVDLLVAHVDWPSRPSTKRWTIDAQPRNGCLNLTVLNCLVKAWGGRAEVPMRTGGTINDTNNKIGGGLFKNLLFDGDGTVTGSLPSEFALEAKGSGVIFDRITVKNISNNSKGTIAIRHGLGCKILNCITKSGRGIMVFHGREASPNEVYNCRVEGAGLFRVNAGTFNGENNLTESSTANYPNSNHALLSDCNGPVTVGFMYSDQSPPPFNAVSPRLRRHTGTVTQSFVSGLTQTGTSPYPVPTSGPTEVLESEVGPMNGTGWDY